MNHQARDAPSIEMQMAPWLLSSMRRRYRGAPAPIDELRVFDAREAPAHIASRCTVSGPSLPGVQASWLRPEMREQGVIMFLHGGGYVFGPGPGHWD